MKRFPVLTALTALVALWTIPAWFIPSEAEGAVPQLINFQGILKDGTGNPVTNGTYFVNFRIYSVPAGGTVLWGDTQTVVTSSGLFNAVLGRGTPVPDTVFNDSVRYLGIQVFPDAEMTPRQRLTTSSYSFRSEEWTSAGQNLFRLNGNVGIGTASPLAKLHLSGAAEGLTIQGTGVGNPGGAYASFRDAAGTPIGYVGDGSSSDQDMYVTSYIGNVYLYTPIGAALTASAIGYVGIGTTTPTAALEVRGDIRLGPTGQYCAPAGEENLRIIRGTVSFTGSIIVGGGFTVSHVSGSGAYTINFTTSFANAPTVTATAFNPGVNLYFATINTVSGSSAAVAIWDASSSLSDGTFHFIAIGPR